MNKKRVLFSVIVIWGLIISCNLPSGAPDLSATEPPAANTNTASPDSTLPADTSTATPIASATETFTPTATETLIPTATACEPSVTAPTPVNVRSGPGTVYEVIGALVAGSSANIAGKNSEGTWWYINFPGGTGGHGWVGGSVVTANCVPATLAIIAAPPTPVLPTSTPTLVATLFAVTSVHYAVSAWSSGTFINCPRIAASITVNAAGSVDYHWTRSDGSSGTGSTLVFGGAGSQSVTADWTLGSFWAPPPNEWMGIYIDAPNHQNFGHAVMPACTAP